MHATFLFLLFLLPSSIHGYSSGVVTPACSSLTPNHGGSAQPSSSSPYTLEVSKGEAAPGEAVEVTLKTANDAFKGFIVQAKDEGTGELAGEITDLGGLSQQLTCSGSAGATASHAGADAKTEVAFTYTLPADAADGTQIAFQFSVVKDFNTYWVKEEGNQKLTVKRAGVAPTAAPTVAPSTEEEAEGDKHASYQGCGESKGCFGLPSGCLPKGDCDALVSYKVVGDTLAVTLHGGSPYTAVGFSADDHMGDDLVLACLGGEKVSAFWNEGKSPKPQEGVTVSDGVFSSENGVNTCSFTLPKSVSAAGGKEFALDGGDHYVLLSHGDRDGDAGIKYHSGRAASGEKVDLAAVGSVAGGGASGSVRAHGALMVFGWLLCAAVGMLFAR